MSSAGERNGWKRFLVLGPNEAGLLVAIVVVVVATAVLDAQHAYLTNPGIIIREVLRSTAMLGIFALGSAIVIIAGGIDLSSGSMIAFSGTVCAATMVILAPEAMKNAEPLPTYVVWAAVAAALFSGVAVGTLHAWLINSLEMPPFIATLGSLVGLRSAARVLAERTTAMMFDTSIGSTQIDIFDRQFRTLALNQYIPLGCFIAVTLLCGFMMRYTVLGRHIYALGGNEEAARLCGIPIRRLKWFVYTLSAVLSAVAGIIYVADQGVAAPEQLARGYELNAIAAAVVGGCSLTGGIGRVTGVALGVLFLRVVIDAVSKLIDTQADMYEGMIVGLVVILAVALSRRRGERAE